MPSINPPTWRGVSTNREQSTIHHLAQELRRLEQSTLVIRENLDNQRNNTNYHITNNPETIVDVSVQSGNENTFDNGIISSDLQSLEERGVELQQRIRNVLKSNAEIKHEMRQYFCESESWNLQFIEESKMLDMELMELNKVITPEIIVEPIPEQSKLSIVTNKTKYWCNVLGATGKNCMASLKRKLEANFLDMPENLNRDLLYYSVLHYL
ncbi:uncharacterized protein LOC110845387 [Folsomia candida]|uniref:Uncharacterized protein n=1 Tax=Folsomia candida TaxID=158441 RepID=A0A226EMQ1_FOLCA|nr:uncharacterized protein LOC110845387 [Folsomia candida]OXA58051.1 hypothetical protein Fcan01_07101 [Folsomia candida]